MRVLSGVVYMTKSRGPRTEPRGTPQRQVCREETLLLHLTRNQREDRLDLNQFRAMLRILNQDDRRVSKILWSMASKAADRSRRRGMQFGVNL